MPEERNFSSRSRSSLRQAWPEAAGCTAGVGWAWHLSCHSPHVLLYAFNACVRLYSCGVITSPSQQGQIRSQDMPRRCCVSELPQHALVASLVFRLGSMH